MGNCICCDQIQPYHNQTESTIVYDTGICGQGPRMATGQPVVCSQTEYQAIHKKAGELGLDIRICCEANFCGEPCCGHGLPIQQIQADLNQQFPRFYITVNDFYQGCDDQGHWEFVVTIRLNSTGQAIARPIMEQRY